MTTSSNDNPAAGGLGVRVIFSRPQVRKTTYIACLYYYATVIHLDIRKQLEDIDVNHSLMDNPAIF